MLGIVKPHKPELLVKDCLYYKLYYCSVCRHLVRRHNRGFAFVNSYEGALLAMLYNEMVVQDMNPVKDRCSGLPLVKVPALAPEHPAVELGAAISLLAFQIKFRDNLNDETGFWIQRYNRFLAWSFLRSFRRMKPRYQRFGIDLDYVFQEQDKLQGLEESTACDIEPLLEQWSLVFSYIMAQAFQPHLEAARWHTLREWFAALGRVLYLIDSMEDLPRDAASGAFNLVLRADPDPQPGNPSWRAAAYNTFRDRVKNEQQQLLKLVPGLALNESAALIQNILTFGLDRELQSVFDSMVLKKGRRQRLLFNCQDF